MPAENNKSSQPAAIPVICGQKISVDFGQRKAVITFKLLEQLCNEYEEEKKKEKEKEKEEEKKAEAENDTQEKDETAKEDVKEEVAAALEGSQIDVNDVDQELNEFFKNEISSAGFTPTEKVISKFDALSKQIGHKVTMKELHSMYKNIDNYEKETAHLINDIAEEFKNEELTKINDMSKNIVVPDVPEP